MTPSNRLTSGAPPSDPELLLARTSDSDVLRRRVASGASPQRRVVLAGTSLAPRTRMKTLSCYVLAACVAACGGAVASVDGNQDPGSQRDGAGGGGGGGAGDAGARGTRTV